MAEAGSVTRSALKLTAADEGLAVTIDIEPKLRTMTLFLSNTAGQDLTFQKGTPAAVYGGKGSLLRLFFEGYFGDLVISDLRCRDSGWNIKSFKNDDCDLAISPARDLTLRDGQTIMIVLDGVESATTVRGTFVIALHGIIGIEKEIYRQITCAVHWESQTAHELPLQVAFEQPTVVADGLRNDLRLILTNAQDAPLRCGNPSFELSFVEFRGRPKQAEPDGALNISDVEVVLEATDYASAHWRVESSASAASNKSWQLRSSSGDDNAILGVGAQASVSFVIKGIVAGRTGVSLATLRYKDAIGYAPGVFNLPIVKKTAPIGGVPRGTIVMWSGRIAEIPEGWILCDGTEGTPDLVSRFIMGTGKGGPDPLRTGGAEAHTHSATATVSVDYGGDHSHGLPSQWYANTASSGRGMNIVDRAYTQQPWQTEASGRHTHAATSKVSITAASNLPPWVALCFIMKIS